MGKGGNHVTIIRSLHSSRIDHHYVHSNISIQRHLTFWVWANHASSQCSKWGKGGNYVIIIRSLHKDRLSLRALKTCIQMQLTIWVRVNHTISQCSKWGKGGNHVTIIRSRHSSRIGYHYVHSNTSIERQLTRWVRAISCQFTVQQVGKRRESCYHYQIASLIKDRPSLRALKYIYSKATYLLSTSKSCQFTV